MSNFLESGWGGFQSFDVLCAGQTISQNNNCLKYNGRWDIVSCLFASYLVCSETHMGLTFCMLVNIHFRKWSKVTVTDYDETTVTTMYGWQASETLPLFVFYFWLSYDGFSRSPSQPAGQSHAILGRGALRDSQRLRRRPRRPKNKNLYDTCSCLTNLPRSLLFDPVSNFSANAIALPVCVPPLVYFIFRIAFVTPR